MQGLTKKQELAIIALLESATQSDAARKTGVNIATLWRWQQEPEFQRAYRAARRQLVETAQTELQKACADAVSTLKEKLQSDHDGTAVRAAGLILDKAIQAIELTELEERLAAIESRLTNGGIK